jgi:protease I
MMDDVNVDEICASAADKGAVIIIFPEMFSNGYSRFDSGRGPEYIRTDKRVQAIVRHFHEKQKPIFTICHGVQILIAVDGVVRGKKVGALGACEPEVTLAGGTYIDLSPTEAYVDGAMVSAKGWTALAAFMRECLKVLGTEIYHN